MIPPIKLPRQLRPIPRIPNNLCKIHRRVKRPAVQNPLIHLDPRLLPRRVAIALPAPRKLSNRPPYRLDPRCFALPNNLLKRALQPCRNGVLRTRVGATAADVIHPNEDHDIFHARYLQSVALVPGEEGRSQTARENGVTPRSLVVDADVVDSLFLHTRDEQVRPAVVPVVGAASPVGDAIPQDHKRGVILWLPGFDCGQEVPVLGVGSPGQGGGADAVAGLHVRGCAAAGVAGDAAA